MKRVIFVFIFFAATFSITKSLATHIVGGEMNYHYLGNNIYEITLTVYRDCFNGIPPFDDPAAIGIFDQDNSLYSTLHVQITNQQSVPNVINSPCLIPPSNVCYEVAQYIFNLTLPPNSGFYTIAYQRCCRNSSIVNLANVQGTGATYMAVITDQAIAQVNSNPVFKNWPPTFICQNAPFTFDHSATDFDGDSLVYEVSNPYNGASMAVPIPDPPSDPPYTNVIFQPPYSINDPFGGVPLHIDSITGELTATPNSTGQFVYGIRVKEYRNGIYLGETVRDFQINVVPCQNITVASIYSPTIACGSLTADFINQSYNTSTYSWFFGDPSTLSDSSNLKNPSYTYPDTGDYTATLIAYSGINPLCNDSVSGLVHVYPVFLTDFYLSNTHCSNVVLFADLSHGIHGSANYWSWYFGDNSISNDTNPVHTFANPGNYNVRLITSVDSACNDTAVKMVHILPNPIAGYSMSLDTCKFEIHLKDSSLFDASVRWEFGDWGTDYFKAGTHKFKDPGTYTIRLIVASDSSCIDSIEKTITIPPLPVPDFDYTSAPCDSTVEFTNRSLNSSKYIWDFGDGLTSVVESPKHTYSISGIVPVKLTAISNEGCPEVVDKNIFFISKKNPDFNVTLDSCKGFVAFNDLTNRAAFYYWDFGDGTTSTEMNPIHVYQNDGDHEIKLVVNKETQCSDSITKPIHFEAPLGEKLFVPNSFTPNADGLNDFYTLSLFRPCETYQFTVFNRWGQKVFETDDAANVHWDGSFNGDLLAEDVYVYIIENNGNRRVGTITIIR